MFNYNLANIYSYKVDLSQRKVLSCRIKTRCLELEMSNEEYRKKFEQLDEDRADIIAYLKRMVQKKENEITELKERLEGLQKVHGNSFPHNVSLSFALLYNICYEKKGP